MIPQIVLLGLHAHLNSIFAHIIEFNLCHRVLEDKEVEVLQDLIHALKLHPDMNNSGSHDGSKESLEEASVELSSPSSPNSSMSMQRVVAPDEPMSSPPTAEPAEVMVEREKLLDSGETSTQSDF